VQKLTDAFATWSGETGGGALRLVVANACYSANLATVLSKHVAFVIGHHAPVQDTSAVQFAEVLYKALGTGASPLQSFMLAKTAAGCDKYCLRGRWDADKFVFAKPSTLSVHEVGVGHIELGQFTRRDATMRILEDWLVTRRSPRIAVVGQGGSGKSTLVQYFLKEVGHLIGGSARLVFFLHGSDLMGGYRVLLQELQDILGRAETAPDKDEDVRARVNALLRDPAIKHKWVGVLDDLPWPESLAELNWLLAPSGGEFPWVSGKTIVTSRCREWMDHRVFGNGFELGNFEVEEAHAFLKDRVEHWRQDVEDGGVTAVARRLAYFPLALTSAAGCANEYSLCPSDYLKELDSNRSRLLESWHSRTKHTGEYPYEMFEVVYHKWQRLSEGKDAMSVMGILRQLAFVNPSNIPIDMFEDLRQHLPILKSHCLVLMPKSAGPQVVSIHSLTQQVIREHLMGNARAQVLQTVTASLARRMDTFENDKPETYMTCTCRAYAPHVQALMAHVDHTDIVYEVAVLAYHTGWFFYTVTSAFTEAKRLWERVLVIWLQLGGGKDSNEVVLTFHAIGMSCRDMGVYPETVEHFKRVLEMWIRMFGCETSGVCHK